MEVSITFLLGGLLALAIGAIAGYLIRQTIAGKQLNTAEGKATKLVEDADKKVQEIILEAKNKAVTILEDAKKKETERENNILRLEDRLSKREESLDTKIEEIDRGKAILEKKADEVRQI